MVIMIPVALLVGAAILMGAVALANMCLPKPRDRYYEYDDEYDDDRPVRYRDRRNRSGAAIPPPSIGHAVLIVIVNGLISFVAGLVIGVMGEVVGGAQDPATMIVVQLFNVVLGFLITASVLTSMLPTTFPRACLVVVFQYVIVIGIALIIFVPLFVLGAGLGGLR